MAPEITIRQLEERDLSEWLRLRMLLWDQASEEDHRDEMLGIIEHPDSQCVAVADAGSGQLAGFLEASIRAFAEDCETENVGYLEGWYVDKSFRRQGIGTSLVGFAEQWASAHGCHEMASDAEVGNETSLETHLHLGYEITSRLVHLRKVLS
nr:aminoglycoside 6'-N-acetyltransferase [uncultured bacterium]